MSYSYEDSYQSFPDIPNELVTEKLLAICESMDFEVRQCKNGTSFYNEGGVCFEGTITDKKGNEYDVTEDDLYFELQNIIKHSNGQMKWISILCASWAVLITADNIKQQNIIGWVEDEIEMIEPDKLRTYSKELYNLDVSPFPAS